MVEIEGGSDGYGVSDLFQHDLGFDRVFGLFQLETRKPVLNCRYGWKSAEICCPIGHIKLFLAWGIDLLLLFVERFRVCIGGEFLFSMYIILIADIRSLVDLDALRSTTHC